MTSRVSLRELKNIFVQIYKEEKARTNEKTYFFIHLTLTKWKKTFVRVMRQDQVNIKRRLLLRLFLFLKEPDFEVELILNFEVRNARKKILHTLQFEFYRHGQMNTYSY